MRRKLPFFMGFTIDNTGKKTGKKAGRKQTMAMDVGCHPPARLHLQANVRRHSCNKKIQITGKMMSYKVRFEGGLTGSLREKSTC